METILEILLQTTLISGVLIAYDRYKFKKNKPQKVTLVESRATTEPKLFREKELRKIIADYTLGQMVYLFPDYKFNIGTDEYGNNKIISVEKPITKSKTIIPILIPDRLIIKHNKDGEKYYVKFDKETVEDYYNKLKETKKFNFWIVTNEEEDGYPVGSLVTDDPIGFSIEIWGKVTDADLANWKEKNNQ